MTPPSLTDVEALLYREARLLDERRFTDWLDLYTDDAVYWMPAAWNQASRTDEVSLFNDDRMTMEARVGRLMHPRAYAQLPPSRTMHLVGNVHLAGEVDGLLRVQSNCLFHEFRAPDRTVLAALVEHRLRPNPALGPGGLLIAFKRVDLIECDQPHRSLQIPI